ncbi:MAG: hypothetical protein M3335_02735, partial [Actinomycetota bacterium]|nr:hypothetical protein [Actinomycetota bacterium]
MVEHRGAAAGFEDDPAPGAICGFWLEGDRRFGGTFGFQGAEDFEGADDYLNPRFGFDRDAGFYFD